MYNKLFTKILDSSIWLEPISTRIVWLTMLASMDENGMCQFASVMNLARRANVPTTEEAAAAVKVLESPDPHSSDPENEGRCIERVPGGWIVLNAPKYRALVTRKESQRLGAERAKSYRNRKKSKSVTKRDEVSGRHATVTQSEADTNLPIKGELPVEERNDALPRLPDGEPDYGAINGFDFEGR
jgi:hypothetical protein